MPSLLPLRPAPLSVENALRTAHSGIIVTALSKTVDLDGIPLSVLDAVTLSVQRGEFVALLGPSGCGKSTLLRIVAGLEEPTTGTLSVAGVPLERRLGASGYLPQRDLLMPWRSVLDNAALPLEYRGMRRAAARREAAALLAEFGLGGFENARPAALSGGMRQRAALARTVLAGRSILLLDEPFGALDALTRLEMQEWLLGIWMRRRDSVLLVTHDLDEAIYLADRIYVMSPRPGHIVADITVPLPRPRPPEVVATAAFAALKGTLLTAVRASRGLESR